MKRLINDHPCKPSLQRTSPPIFKCMNLSKDSNESFLEHIMQVLLIRDISRTYLGQIIRILAIEFIHGEGIIFCKKAYNMLLFIKPGQAHYSVGETFY